MPLPADAEGYLRSVRQCLSSLKADERDDILNELKAHLLDRVAQGKTDVLAGFEPPEVLAAGFLQDHALRNALVHGGTWRLARALLVATRDSVLLLCVVLPLILFQLTGIVLCGTAVAKVFHPQFGLWVGSGSFYIGTGSQEGVREILGWWFIPVTILVGVVVFVLSNRAMRALVRWRLRSARRYAV
jgi:uncharacterized membrane protein